MQVDSELTLGKRGRTPVGQPWLLCSASTPPDAKPSEGVNACTAAHRAARGAVRRRGDSWGIDNP